MDTQTHSSQNSAHSPLNACSHGVCISVRKLCKSFEGTPVLKDVSLEICSGEVFVIMGPSGSGKTVLLRHLIGLMAPDQGQVLVDGQSPLSEDLRQRIRMAMVFQNGGLLNSLSVEENVGLYLREHRLKPTAQIKEIVASELAEFGLSPADAAKYPYELSGGMKKRVAIARAIVMEPKVVLYDEPTSELDPLMAYTVSEVIGRVHRQYQQTTVIVTHDRELAFGIANHIAILINGMLLKVGTPDEIRNCEDPQIKNFLTINYKTKNKESHYE